MGWFSNKDRSEPMARRKDCGRCQGTGKESWTVKSRDKDGTVVRHTESKRCSKCRGSGLR